MTFGDILFICALLAAVAGVVMLACAFLGALAAIGAGLLATSGALFVARGSLREDSET